MANNSRWHTVMSGLLYPAFLGNLTYLAFEDFLKPAAFFATASGILVAVLVVHYVFDFAYTVANKGGTNYGVGQFLFDLAIVVCLYLAIRVALKVHDNEPLESWHATPALWMLLTKLFAVAWEVIEALPNKKWNRIKKLAVGMDGIFGVAYLLPFLYWLCSANAVVAWVSVIVILDAAGYIVHERFRKEWGDI